MNHLFPAAFAAADPVQQRAVFNILSIPFGCEPELLDVLDMFDCAPPHIQHCCLVAVGLVTR